MDLITNLHLTLKLVMYKVKVRDRLQWIGFMQIYQYVKYERTIINSIPNSTMNLNTNFPLTLKPVTLKVKLNNKGCKG